MTSIILFISSIKRTILHLTIHASLNQSYYICDIVVYNRPFYIIYYIFAFRLLSVSIPNSNWGIHMCCVKAMQILVSSNKHFSKFARINYDPFKTVWQTSWSVNITCYPFAFIHCL